MKSALNKLFGKFGDSYRTICTYCVAITLTTIATECLKNYCGYLRPIFFTECEPDENFEECTGEDFNLNELRKSFVSGHASAAFCGCTLLTLYLERTFGISCVQVVVGRTVPASLANPTRQQSRDEDEERQPISADIPQQNPGTMYMTVAYRKNPGLRRLGSILSFLPMGVALWVAASRVVDNVHFPADVVGGSVLGAGIALYCHPLW